MDQRRDPQLTASGVSMRITPRTTMRPHALQFLCVWFCQTPGKIFIKIFPLLTKQGLNGEMLISLNAVPDYTMSDHKYILFRSYGQTFKF